MTELGNPLIASPPREVHLPNSPLVRVIAQVRFPAVLSIEKREFVAPFQEALRARYPILRVEQTHGVQFGGEEPFALSPAVTWRMSDVDAQWRLSLASDFVAIETTRYQSRADLLGRWGEVLEALGTHVKPGAVDRVGLRYIDRLGMGALAELANMVKPEILGVSGTAVAPSALHALTEALFLLPNQAAELRARWGFLPEGGTVDPAALEPINERSWILDLDAFSTETRPFEPQRILSDSRGYAERIYGLFRWMVTNEFLRFFGGEV